MLIKENLTIIAQELENSIIKGDNFTFDKILINFDIFFNEFEFNHYEYFISLCKNKKNIKYYENIYIQLSKMAILHQNNKEAKYVSLNYKKADNSFFAAFHKIK